MKYSELAAINVNEHVEKKQNLSYLSWAWAVDALLRLDENATWEHHRPEILNDTMMVFCSVTAFGRTRKAQLPVMDHRNKAIINPDAFQVNVAMQRCLAKAIALHGIGLYIYAGEDLPSAEEAPAEVKHAKVAPKVEQVAVEAPINLPEDKTVSVPPELTSEGDIVDWIVAFMEEFIPTMKTTDGLRDFWKVNKQCLSRVQAFSKPKYQVLEMTFKQRAGEIKNAE